MADDCTGLPSPRFGAIILAAGASSRMGAVKQLMMLDGAPLVVRTVRSVIESGADPVVVVLGAHEEAISRAIAGLPVIVASNPDWSTGMASSLKVGLGAASDADPNLTAVLITPCDQPALTTAMIAQLVAAHRDTGKTACSRFNGRNGSPAVFGSALFPALEVLTGDRGARDLINASAGSVVPVDLPALGFDLDTPADVRRWQG